MISVLAVCGSLQARSGNLSLLQAAAALAPACGCRVEIFDGVRALPLFNPDLEDQEPASVLAWRAAVAGHEALLIACPEYGYSLPGSLKNAIDWLIGSGELDLKPIATTAAVPHLSRGRGGLKALSDTLTAVNARQVGGEPIAKGPDLEKHVSELLTALARAARPPA